jgi:hypothetical protein
VLKAIQVLKELKEQIQELKGQRVLKVPKVLR